MLFGCINEIEVHSPIGFVGCFVENHATFYVLRIWSCGYCYYNSLVELMNLDSRNTQIKIRMVKKLAKEVKGWDLQNHLDGWSSLL